MMMMRDIPGEKRDHIWIIFVIIWDGIEMAKKVQSRYYVRGHFRAGKKGKKR